MIVAGCLAERDREATAADDIPKIDQLIGVFAGTRSTANTMCGLGRAGRDRRSRSADRTAGQSFPAGSQPSSAGLGRLRLTLPHLAYLKIAEGCNRLCSFCSIPRMRGPYASKPIDEVAAEAEELAADGVRELVLVAQDTTFYGLDRGGRPQLAELLRRLEAVEGVAWIRLMYLYPANVTDELIEVIASSKKVLPYLDIPLQHISDEVLQRMRRRIGREETERLLDRLRAAKSIRSCCGPR